MTLMKLREPAVAAVAITILASRALAAEPMTLNDYMALEGPAPTEHIIYGPAPLQYAEFFRPAGAGPFPVAVLIHGGCFQNRFQGMPQMRGMAGALAADGIAVWSIEYRGVDTAGGGYPGTFLDVRAALELLGTQAGVRQLDMRRMVIVGHSAGAALALWGAGRAKLPKSSPLYEEAVLPVGKVVALGGFANLRHMVESSKSECGFDLRQLTGLPSAKRPDVFADTNPFDLTPTGSATTFINGDHDSIVPPAQSAADAGQARARGDAAETLVLPGASHYDEVAVTSPAWKLVEPVILKAVGVTPELRR